MGINVLSTSDNGVIKGVASGDITAGDLVCNTDTGFVTKFPTDLGIDTGNKTTAGVVQIGTETGLGSQYYAPDDYYYSGKVAALGNGNVVYVFSGDGSATANLNVNFQIKKQNGQNVTPVTQVSNDTGVDSVQVVTLSSTRFAVLWRNSTSSNMIHCVIFDNDGNEQVAEFDCFTDGCAANGWGFAWMARGGNGNLAVVQTTGATGTNAYDINLSLFTSAGVVTAKDVTVAALGAGSYYLNGVYLHSNDDVSIAYTNGSGDRASRFNASGVRIGTEQTLNSSINSFNSGAIGLNVGETTDGSFVVTASNTTQQLNIVNSGCTSSSSVALSGGFFATQNAASIVMKGDVAYIFGRTGSTFCMQSVNCSTLATEVQPFAYYTAAAGIGNNYCSGSYGFDLGALGFLVVSVSDNSGTNHTIAFEILDTQGAIVGSRVVWKNNISSNLQNFSAIMTDQSVFCLLFTNNANNEIEFANFDPLRRSVLGVAANTAAEGESVSVLTDGNYTINDTFQDGGNFDNTSTTIAGCKGMVVGNTASLRGTKA